jgi:CRISPR-associated protein Cas1
VKQLLNTLFVTTQGAYLSKDGETVSVQIEQEVALRVPIHTLQGIACFGRVSVSPFLLGFCAERGVGLSFLTESGRFLARVQGPVSGNILLRREQYRKSGIAAESAEVARSVVIAKIANCRNVVLRAVREKPNQPGAEALSRAAKRLAWVIEELQVPRPLDVVRGHEGDAARVYFEVFDHLITESKDSFFFCGRSRRPPLDNVNALLSFLYTLLTHDVAGALEGVGLDPAAGYLHRDRPGRPSLALDLVEELRPVLADRLALSMINRRQVRPDGFRKSESGAIEMDDSTRKQVLAAYQKRKQEEVVHPFLKERVQYGIVPHIQSLLLARHLRGDLDGYPSFLWR